MSEDDLFTLGPEEAQRLFEIYQEECRRHGQHPSIRDFVVWVRER